MPLPFPSLQVTLLSKQVQELSKECEEAEIQGKVLESVQDLNKSFADQVEVLTRQLQQQQSHSQHFDELAKCSLAEQEALRSSEASKLRESLDR